MAKRKLNETEIKLTKKGIENFQTDLEYDNAMLKVKELAIENAPIIYKKQLSELRQEVGKIKNEISSLKQIIEIYNDQIKNGVEIKEKSDSNSVADNTAKDIN